MTLLCTKLTNYGPIWIVRPGGWGIGLSNPRRPGRGRKQRCTERRTRLVRGSVTGSRVRTRSGTSSPVPGSRGARLSEISRRIKRGRRSKSTELRLEKTLVCKQEGLEFSKRNRTLLGCDGSNEGVEIRPESTKDIQDQIIVGDRGAYKGKFICY